MNTRYTVELAALISKRSAPVVEGGRPLPQGPLRDLWRFSRLRLYDWLITLDAADSRRRPGTRRVPATAAGQQPRLIEEILCSDVLTRVSLAVLSAAAESRASQSPRRVARHLLLGHLHVRCLALDLMSGGLMDRCHAHRLNRFRRRAERWTDLLLSPLMGRHDVREFCHNEQRTRAFAEDFPASAADGLTEPAWHLTLCSIRRAFPASPPISPFRTACLRRMVSSLEALFSPGVLQPAGPARFSPLPTADAARGLNRDSL